MSFTDLTQPFSYTSKKLKKKSNFVKFLFYTVDYVSESTRCFKTYLDLILNEIDYQSIEEK